MKILTLLILFSIQLFSQAWFTTLQSATLMVSGVDFNNTGGPLKFNHPTGIATRDSNFILCDRFNNRVLIWNTAPGVYNANPNLVLGQSNFTTNNPGTSKSNMNWPGNASVGSNGKLVVADTYNHRILIWNSFPTTNGQAADVSIHLPTITPLSAPQKWEWPWGVWTDGNKLAATATQGSTILFWNSIPTADNQSPDFTITHTHFGTPRTICSDGSTYFIVGDHNAKVSGDQAGTFFWNTYPTTADQPYDFYRNEWIKGTKLPDGKFIAGGNASIYVWDTMPTNASSHPTTTITPSYYNSGDGPDVIRAKERIYINNYNGNTVLVYNVTPTASSHPNFAVGVSSHLYNTLDSIGYIQNPVFATDGTRLIVASDFDKKFYIYNTFPTTSGVFPNQYISTSSYDLAPWDIALYGTKFVAIGKKKVCIWNDNSNLSTTPSTTFNDNIGTATFSDLRGVALDNDLFYLGDYDGKVFIWNGIPPNASTNPALTLNYGSNKLARISSDGQYLCVVQQEPAAVYVYKVDSLKVGNTTPFKEILTTNVKINLPTEAITFGGSLAIANTNYSTALLWQDINNAPDTNYMVILGQEHNYTSNTPQIGQNKLFLPGSLLYANDGLWVGEIKFSSRILKFDDLSIVPVELISFKAKAEKNKVILSWNTATETNNYGFEIERKVRKASSFSDRWEKIGFIYGNGNSNSPKEYSFIDETFKAGTVSYRLKQIDNDGSFSYSPVVKVDIYVPKEFSLKQNYPNPFNPKTTISFTLEEAGFTSLKIYNALGQELMTLLSNEYLEAGEYHRVEFDGSKLSSGMYLAKLWSGNKVEMKKMLLIK